MRIKHCVLHPVVRTPAPFSSSTRTSLTPRKDGSRLAVIVGDNAGLAFPTAAAPLDVGDHAVLLAAVEGVVDFGPDGGVGGGLELGVRVAWT